MRTLALALLVGCGPKLDPLLPMKAELAEARRTPAGDAPHARLTLAPAAATGLIRRALDNGQPLAVPVMMGTSALIQPDLSEPELRLTRSPYCDCPRASLRLAGKVDVSLGGLLGGAKLADDLGFVATAEGTMRLSIDRAGADGGQVIALEPEPKDPWTIGITLSESTGMINDRMIERQVVGPLQDVLSRPIPVFTLPADLPISARKVDLDDGPVPTASVWLDAAAPEDPPLVRVEQGWAIATTEANVLAGARAAFATVPQTRRWQLEPTGVQIRENPAESPGGAGEIVAQVRLHKVARKVKWRTFEVTAALTIGERITVTPTSVVETGAKGFGLSLVAPFVAGKVRKQVLALSVDEAGTITRKVGRSEVTFAVERIVSEGTEILVYGSVR